MKKTYRFFYHYYKQKNKMSIHFKKSCIVVDNIQCLVPCISKWNKRQPHLVMQGYAKEIIISKNNKTATIV